jgi:DNA-binding response OmpR family regulator
MKTKLLLVDDDKDIVEFLQYNLVQEELKVITAYSGNRSDQKVSS